MRRRSQEGYDEEVARREPLLGSATSGSGGATPPAAGTSIDAGGGTSSRGLSPDRWEEGHPGVPTIFPRGGSIRLKRVSTVPQEEVQQHGGGLVLKGQQEDGVRELEVEVVAGAVAEAVAEAVQDAVHEAVHDAMQQAIEENVSFDVRANVYTLIAVTGVILFWRGVWNSWDSLFGTDLASNMGSMVVGLIIMLVIRILNLPLVEGLPGG